MENDDGSHRRKHQGGSPPGGAGQHLLHEKGAVKHHLFEGIASLKWQPLGGEAIPQNRQKK